MKRHVRFTIMSLVTGLALTLGGCSSGEQAASDAATNDATEARSATGSDLLECTVEQRSLASDVSSADWAGAYTVALLATDGARVDGALTLVPQSEELQTIIGPGGEPAPNTRIPLYGWIDVDLAAMGAVVPGDAGSRDPEAPGVALLESRMGDQAPDILLRIGSEANQRGVIRFDGAFTVLRVTEAGTDGFRGRWNSGVGTQRSEGTFCAFR